MLHARDDTLRYAPSWPEARVRELDDVHGAAIVMVGSGRVEAIGIGRDGAEQTLLRHGEWRVGS